QITALLQDPSPWNAVINIQSRSSYINYPNLGNPTEPGPKGPLSTGCPSAYHTLVGLEDKSCLVLGRSILAKWLCISVIQHNSLEV
ncbi:mCG145662, partial [Mus musculus]